MTTRGVGLSEEERETLADWLGALPESRNVFDITDEATTVLTMGVEDLARELADSDWLATIVAVRTADLDAQVARVEGAARDLMRTADRPTVDSATARVNAATLDRLRATLSPAQPDTDVCPKCGSRKVSTDGVRWCAVCDDCPTPQPDTERGGGS